MIANITFNLNNKNLRISLSYITNFRPSDFSNITDFKIFKKKSERKHKEKIVSRNFFLFLLLIKFMKSDGLDINTCVFVKPFYKKIFVILRAPYRHKLSRHQFILSRYSVLCSIFVDFQKIDFSTEYELIDFIKTVKHFYVWFESNIVYQHQAKVFLKFTLNKIFLLKSYI